MKNEAIPTKQIDIVKQAQQAATMLKLHSKPLDSNQLDLLFSQARSQNGWLDKPVDDKLIKRLYDLTKMGATSMNCCPARFVFLRTIEGKKRLLPALAEGNVSKVLSAPVVAIIGYDLAFHEHLPQLHPHRDVRSFFAGNDSLIASTAFRNGTLQGAYLMLAAKALCLDCGPMSGFDNEKTDEIFFSGTQIKSNFICSIGHGDPSKLFQRLPRFEFNEVCELV